MLPLMDWIVFFILATIITISTYYGEIKAKIKGEEYKETEFKYKLTKTVFLKNILPLIIVDLLIIYLANLIGRWIYFDVKHMIKWIFPIPSFLIRYILVSMIVWPYVIGRIVYQTLLTAETEDDFLAAILFFNFPMTAILALMSFLIGHAYSVTEIFQRLLK